MNREEVLEIISENFLLECVGAKVEEVNELSKMLKDINYLDEKEKILSKITECEILDIDSFDVIESNELNGTINIKYEMNYILQALIDEEYIWRITGSVDCIFEIPDANSFNWSDYNWENMNKSELLDHKNLIKFHEIDYNSIECDSLYL